MVEPKPAVVYDITVQVAAFVGPDSEWPYLAQVPQHQIPFTRHFYKYVPPRPLEEIDADLNKLIREISDLLREVEA